MKPVELIETFFQPGGDMGTWLRTTLHALPWLRPDGFGVAYEIDLSTGASFGTKVASKASAELEAAFARSENMLSSQEEIAAAYRFRVGTVAKHFPPSHAGFSKLLQPLGMKDVAGVFAIGADRRGVVFCALSPEIVKISREQMFVWSRLTAHIYTAWRLRAAFGNRTDPSHAAVVLSPSGQILHAAGEAKQSSTLQVLRNFARSVDRARSSAGKRDPIGALEAWTALTEGRWSLVDHVDSDGKRFCVFMANAPNLVHPQALTPRQRHVVALAALGLSNKLIAYELGIDINAVNRDLRASLRRLGITSRIELINSLGPLAQALELKPRIPRALDSKDARTAV